MIFLPMLLKKKTYFDDVDQTHSINRHPHANTTHRHPLVNCHYFVSPHCAQFVHTLQHSTAVFSTKAGTLFLHRLQLLWDKPLKIIFEIIMTARFYLPDIIRLSGFLFLDENILALPNRWNALSNLLILLNLHESGYVILINLSPNLSYKLAQQNLPNFPNKLFAKFRRRFYPIMIRRKFVLFAFQKNLSRSWILVKGTLL